MQQKPIAGAVASACSSLELAAAQGRTERCVLRKMGGETMVAKRRLTVDVRIEAEAADDSPLGSLVAEALQEFIEHQPGQSGMSGKFESKAGLDVTWSARNEFFDAAGNPVAHEEKS
jgi:hypothetical protein